MSPVIHCPSPHQDKRHTHIHTQIYRSPFTFCSLSTHTVCAVHSQQRDRIVHCAFFSLCIRSVYIYSYSVCVEMGDGGHPLGPHQRLLTDQERCLMLHHRRVIREGFVIFADIFGTQLVSFFSPPPQSLTGPPPVTIRKHSLHSKETHSD